MNANSKGWSPDLFPESDIAYRGFSPFVSHVLSATRVCSPSSCSRPSLRNVFLGEELVVQTVVGTGVTRVGANRSSFMQRRKGTPSERELVERAPLGRAISKGLASHQLVHLSLALSVVSRE